MYDNIDYIKNGYLGRDKSTDDERVNEIYRPNVLIVGSGKNSIDYKEWDVSDHIVVTLNNAWKVDEDKFNCMFASCEFSFQKRPQTYKEHQTSCSGARVNAIHDYYLGMNPYGGLYKCGGTMFLMASYWSLWFYNPKKIGYIGCDMDYEPSSDGSTHFYGVGDDIKTTGIPDPFRKDPNHPELNDLNSLQERFLKFAKKINTTVVNYSDNMNSKLIYTKESFHS